MVTGKIAILEGDGIGPEIMREAFKVLVAIGRKHDHHFTYVYANFGGVAYDNHGHPFPKATVEVCDKADAILKGPIGGPKYDTIPDPNLRPERGALLPLRKRYDTFANIRPVKITAELAGASPLRPDIIRDLDILIIRELTGGSYFGRRVETGIDEYGDEFASDERKYTRGQIERIARFAFSEAIRTLRKGVVSVDKANVLACSRFWRRIVDEVQKDFPYKKLEHQYVDSVAFDLMVDPMKYDDCVLLTENEHGDIIADEAAGLMGSLGLMPSACVGPKKSYYEPAHGSAPDIAGKGIANPFSMIGSAALMLEVSFALFNEAKEIWDALYSVFGDGYRTAELARPSTPKKKIVSTKEFGDLVAERIGK